ncbi:MAG: hypothetical protein WCT27_02355 [Patescibacteria group bacterium]|jgi:dTMP kinase
MKKGRLVIFDGIDGSGKGTLVNILADWAEQRRLKVFDMREYGRTYHSMPEPEEIKKYDVLLSAEPTFSLVGQAIREEIVRHNGRDYTAMETAQAYALDRLILYRRVIIPALRMGKIIFQERGLTTSVCYQPIQADRITVRQILRLSGNELAMRYRPDLFIIVDVKPETAIGRLAKRMEKKDSAIFEKLVFLKKAQARFMSGWYKRLFEAAGSRVVYVSTDVPVADSGQTVIAEWERLIGRK